MSVILFSVAELADVALVGTTGPISTANNQRLVADLAQNLAAYSVANTAAYNISYPVRLAESATAEAIEQAAKQHGLSGKLEQHRQHGANVVGIFADNAVAQNGQDCLAADQKAAYGLALVLTQVVRCVTGDELESVFKPLTSELEPRSEPLDRAEAIKRIRAALKRRSGKTWSVTGGRGTAWGWLCIDAPPARRKYGWDGTGKGGHSSVGDRVELAKLLDLKDIHFQGHKVPSGSAFWQEYVDRAEGREPAKCGEIY